MKNIKLNIGVGFVTGRKLFQNVLKTYINNWLEQGLIQNHNIRLHLFIAYDLKYKNTNINDYKNIPSELAEMVDSISFYDENEIVAEQNKIIGQNLLSIKELNLIFGEGYGKKRNVITYFAIKNKMDKLVFIDDDEYPVATLKNTQNNLLWMGQGILSTHLKFNDDADITHGHHCGYISPIPYITFNDVLKEEDFRAFIEAISNDIISWEKIKNLIIVNKGVTYADAEIINHQKVQEVDEENGMKFISGANLCFNLKDYKKLPPFYNPPGARGEDTFMSTALSNLKVLKVPCYTFHDGFSMYNNILNGVLPLTLNPIDSISPSILKRFISATIGWIRYKPLLVYITNQSEFESIMKEIQRKLDFSIPKLCNYFKTHEFYTIHTEFATYRRNAKKHFNEFEKTKIAWATLMSNLHNER
jgi:hypothetical protein